MKAQPIPRRLRSLTAAAAFLASCLLVLNLLRLLRGIDPSRPSDPGRHHPAVPSHKPPIVSVTVINLPRSTDRWARFASDYSSHPLPGIDAPHRLSAIDPGLASSGGRTKYENGVVGCGLSHLAALGRVARGDAELGRNITNGTTRSEDDDLPEDCRWHLICEDDATGNFTALHDLLVSRHRCGVERRHGGSQPSRRRPRVGAINLYSPKLAVKYRLSHFAGRGGPDGPAPGFGTHMTAYLVTTYGAQRMLDTLSKWENTAHEVLRGTALGNRTTIGDRGDLVPIDVAVAKSPRMFWGAVSYRGGGTATGRVGPTGDASSYAGEGVRASLGALP